MNFIDFAWSASARRPRNGTKNAPQPSESNSARRTKPGGRRVRGERETAETRSRQETSTKNYKPKSFLSLVQHPHKDPRQKQRGANDTGEGDAGRLALKLSAPEDSGSFQNPAMEATSSSVQTQLRFVRTHDTKRNDLPVPSRMDKKRPQFPS